MTEENPAVTSIREMSDEEIRRFLREAMSMDTSQMVQRHAESRREWAKAAAAKLLEDMHDRVE